MRNYGKINIRELKITEIKMTLTTNIILLVTGSLLIVIGMILLFKKARKNT